MRQNYALLVDGIVKSTHWAVPAVAKRPSSHPIHSIPKLLCWRIKIFSLKRGDWRRFMVWLAYVAFCKNILNRRINSINKYLENTYIAVAYNRNIFSSPTFLYFVTHVFSGYFHASRDPFASTIYTYFFITLSVWSVCNIYILHYKLCSSIQ